MASPKLVPLELTDDERGALEGWVRRRKTAQALSLRSRIILACADGRSNQSVAADLGVSRTTVAKWRSFFVRSRLEGLTDEPGPGRPRTISDEKVEQVVTAALEQAPPGGDTHWTTRSMARSAGVSQSTVARIWRTFGLKPHVMQTWKLSADPQFIAKVRDVVGLYLAPPENALVLCVDEKSQIQALDRTAPCLPMLPTSPARRTHNYVRNGTISPFAAFDLASGLMIAQHYCRHRHREFLGFLKMIDAAVPQDLDLHLVLDNYATCKTLEVHKWLLRHPRFHLHFTPTSSSWLNLVERWFAELTNRKLRRSALRSVTELEADIRKWINEWNRDPKPFIWTKTADEILESPSFVAVDAESPLAKPSGMSDTRLIVPGMNEPPSRYEVTVRVAHDDGRHPNPPEFAVAASQAGSSRNASVVSAHTADEVIYVVSVAAADRSSAVVLALAVVADAVKAEDRLPSSSQ